MTYDQWKTTEPQVGGDCPEDDGPSELELVYADLEQAQKINADMLGALRENIAAMRRAADDAATRGDERLALTLYDSITSARRAIAASGEKG